MTPSSRNRKKSTPVQRKPMPGTLHNEHNHLDADSLRAVRRLRIIAGQVEGLRKMIERQEYCIDVLRQSLAIKEALSSLEEVVLRGHLYKHVAQQMRSGYAARASEELLEIYRLTKRK